MNVPVQDNPSNYSEWILSIPNNSTFVLKKQAIILKIRSVVSIGASFIQKHAVEKNVSAVSISKGVPMIRTISVGTTT